MVIHVRMMNVDMNGNSHKYRMHMNFHNYTSYGNDGSSAAHESLRDFSPRVREMDPFLSSSIFEFDIYQKIIVLIRNIIVLF